MAAPNSQESVNMSSTPVASSPAPVYDQYTKPASDQQQQGPPAEQPASPGLERPLADIISEKFPPFDAQSRIVQPFGDAEARDAAFQEELSQMLLKAILDTHAWAASRPNHESTVEGRKLEGRLAHIMDTEREQGMCSPKPPSESSSSSFYRFRIVEQTREKLGEFVRQMKTALAALTGTSF